MNHHGWFTLGYILFIYLTLPLLPPTVNWIKANIGIWPIRVVGPALFAVLLAYFTAALFRRRRPGKALLRLIPLAAAAVFVLVYKRSNPVEQIHLVEYGLVGYLAWRAAGRDGVRGGFGRLALWAGIALASGILDELIQGLIPNRVCDVTDMVANVVSVAVGLATSASISVPSSPASPGAARPRSIDSPLPPSL